MDFLKGSAPIEVERGKKNQIGVEPAIMKIHAPPIQVVTSKTKQKTTWKAIFCHCKSFHVLLEYDRATYMQAVTKHASITFFFYCLVVQ